MDEDELVERYLPLLQEIRSWRPHQYLEFLEIAREYLEQHTGDDDEAALTHALSVYGY